MSHPSVGASPRDPVVGSWHPRCLVFLHGRSMIWVSDGTCGDAGDGEAPTSTEVTGSADHREIADEEVPSPVAVNAAEGGLTPVRFRQAPPREPAPRAAGSLGGAGGRPYGPAEAWIRSLVPSKRCQVATALPATSTPTWGLNASCPAADRVCTPLNVPAAERVLAWIRAQHGKSGSGTVPSKRDQVNTASPSASTATWGANASARGRRGSARRSGCRRRSAPGSGPGSSTRRRATR